MKFKGLLLIIGLLSFVAGTPAASARTPITGTLYGENFGLIHLDYTTALRPEGYAGEQNNFYIPPENPEFTGPGLIDFTAQIYDLSDGDKCSDSFCLLTGFLWNDQIGWIILDGEQIQKSMADPNDFPPTHFARMNFTGRLTGYVWSEKAGWISLAKDPVNGTRIPSSEQTAEDWGVFLDLSAEVIVQDQPEGENDITLGRPLQGYAWSESLGWLKFFSGPGDDPSFGAYTNWILDRTAPQFFGEANAWFKNNHELGVVTWPALAADAESGIRGDSAFTVTRDPGDAFAGCLNPLAVNQTLEGGKLSLTIPSIGLLGAAPRGYCRYTLTGVIYNNAGLSFTIGEGPGADLPPLVFSVRAGDLDEANSSLEGADAGQAAVADGRDEVIYGLHLVDIAGNPVISIDDENCGGCPRRSVTVTAALNNQMRYDTLALNDSFPVKVNSAYLDALGEVTTPVGGILPEGEFYPLRLTSFAPTTPFTSLSFKQFEVRMEEEALPRVTSLGPLTPASQEEAVFLKPDAMSNPRFEPAFVTRRGQIRTGEFLSELIDDLPATLEFNLVNQSEKALNHWDLDTVFEYYGGLGAALIETHRIDHESTEGENLLGWLDPIAPIVGAHYEIFNGLLDLMGTALDGTRSLFHAAYPLFEDLGAPAVIADDGSYPIAPVYGIPGNRIDRSDEVEMVLPPHGESPLQSILFTPAFIFLPPDIDANDVNLRVLSTLAYRFDDQPQFTLYEPDPLVNGIQMNSTGAQFKGIGIGEAIYSDGALDVIGGRGVKALTEQMRRNGAELTLNLDSCSIATPLFENDEAGHLTLKTSGPCVKEDPVQKTIIAYYEGEENDILEMGDGSDKTLFIPPDTRYTLIAKGGLNLFFKNNVAYQDETSSFGIILLSEDGKGAHVYLDPAPTNLIGNLYIEGSLLSSPDPAAGLFYYGGEDPEALSSQLYWQGSIASLNTLGGASSNLFPQGIACPAGITLYQCAQRYDMNFLRRFSARSDAIANQGKFSGGGSCAAGLCILGPLPTTITLEEGRILKAASKSLDAFFIEPTSRPSPPGFRLTGEQESSQVIR